MTPEAKTLSDVIGLLKRLRQMGEPIWWYKVRGNPYQQCGVPDLAIVYYGAAIYLEVKAPGCHPTPLQEKTMADIRRASGVAEAVSSDAEAAAVLAAVKLGKQVIFETLTAPKWRMPVPSSN